MKKRFQNLVEDDVMQLLAAGDITALEVLYQLHYENIYRYAVRILGNATEADDIAQNVFLKIWKYRKTYTPTKKFRAWALRICANLCIDRMRKADYKDLALINASNVMENRDNSLTDIAIYDEKLAIAAQVFHRLPYVEQQLLALRFDGDLSIAEIAETLGCSVRTVHYRTSLAIQRLKKISGDSNERN